MLKKLIPHEKGFFSLFQEVAEKIVRVSEQFQQMIANLDQAVEYSVFIEQQEREGDKLTRATFDLLHKTFITPFDRYDIHKLTSNLDDVLDLLNSTAQKIRLYKIHYLPQEIHNLGNLVLKVATHVKAAISELGSLKNSENILQDCRQIITAENEAEQLVMTGLARLLEDENDFKVLLKIKEIYESIKRIFDKCQNLANIMKGIVLEYA